MLLKTHLASKMVKALGFSKYSDLGKWCNAYLVYTPWVQPNTAKQTTKGFRSGSGILGQDHVFHVCLSYKVKLSQETKNYSLGIIIS